MKNERNITITEINIIAKVNHPIIFEKRVLILSSSIFLSLASLITIKRMGTVTTALLLQRVSMRVLGLYVKT